METNKTILMREVVSIGERMTMGAVKDVCVDCEKGAVSHFVIGDFEHGAPRLLPYHEIRAVGDSFITINKEAVLLDPESRRSKEILENGCKLVGVEVFSGDGDRIGSVGGFEFEPKNGSISSITLSDGAEYPATNVLFYSPKYVFVESIIEPEPAVVAEAVEEPKVKAEQVIEEVKEEPAQEESAQEEPVEESAKEEEKVEDSLRDLLIGKTMNEKVTSIDNAFVIEKGATITEEVFAEAEKHDALLMLTVNIDD